ncbi:hypothetical protein MTO96_031122 [Rhipicephalus appendiculatus]
MAREIDIMILLAVLVLYHCSDTVQAQTRQRNIKEFLDVSEVIWTYNSTRGSTLLCRKDLKLYATQDKIIFERSHFLKTKRLWTDKILEGNYSASYQHKKATPSYKSIFVGSLGYKWNKEELLVYQSDDNKCGVFKIFTKGKSIDYYSVDLRMKNSSVHDGPIQNGDSSGCVSLNHFKHTRADSIAPKSLTLMSNAGYC